MKKSNLIFLLALFPLAAVLAAAPQQNDTPIVKNGSFEEMNQNGTPKYWALRKGASIVKTDNGNALKLEGIASYAFELIWWGELQQGPQERKITFSFKASGEGTVKVAFFRYSDTTNPRSRKNMGTDFAGPYQLTETPQEFKGEYTIKANEWIGFGFLHAPNTAIIDDVSIQLVK